ncbi:hypothetical protein Krac_3386 [Ktedonobacter racemifer DSM 44963]|uniref:Uncharacterized protein n=1 Tax=Ktedonobacter racemifer DSM 44963 TaxID=485913 RepID=D6U175_KTERA|nr:hypothetical protein Krac_3386 [Ktedonobacter racemifer DSM 44963]
MWCGMTRRFHEDSYNSRRFPWFRLKIGRCFGSYTISVKALLYTSKAHQICAQGKHAFCSKNSFFTKIDTAGEPP